MIVIDASAFISLAIADALQPVIDEYDVHTTQQVIDELETTADYDDIHGRAADHVLTQTDTITIHETADPGFETSRIDTGEASCTQVAKTHDADFLLTDDLRALPELQQLTDAQVAISPILLRALVKRGVPTNEQAKERLEEVAVSRDWLGAPISRRAKHLFND